MSYIGTDGVRRSYNPSENQQICRKLVEREVVHCVSVLVSELVGKDDRWLDELSDVIDIPDWEAACENNDINVYYSDACEAYMFEMVDGSESECYNTYYEACKAAVEHFNLDHDYKEALEHWAVSKWFGEQLQKHGEMVIFDFLDFNAIWGRTTSGQAILLDNVVSEIAEEMEILEGMRNSW